jgi:hypothetical protein
MSEYPPQVPTTAELRRADDFVEGGARKLFDIYCQNVEKYQEREDARLSKELTEQRHLHNYRALSIIAGTGLAMASLLLCGYAIYKEANLLPVAGVLGPVAGIAGVFVWGYRPKDTPRVALPAIKGQLFKGPRRAAADLQVQEAKR